MTTYLETNSGLLNNAGYQSVAGNGIYQTQTQIVLNPVESIELPWLQGPSPEALFKLQSKPNPKDSVKETKCTTFHNSILENVSKQFVIAPQRGYKLRGFTEDNLRGISAIENQGTGIQKFIKIDDSEEAQLIVDNEVVNTEAAKYKYGSQEFPPNYGKNLPGSLSTLIKSYTPGKIIQPVKRSGYSASGYYSGYQSAKSNLTGVMDPPVGT